jgi:hypothetical protein
MDIYRRLETELMGPGLPIKVRDPLLHARAPDEVVQKLAKKICSPRMVRQVMGPTVLGPSREV